ncbi:hypothetical protein DXG01_012099 [Tephrocybe rancida]|nr:hypothetical protein DXG01_012099 [Tephrocybe rancida]
MLCYPVLQRGSEYSERDIPQTLRRNNSGPLEPPWSYAHRTTHRNEFQSQYTPRHHIDPPTQYLDDPYRPASPHIDCPTSPHNYRSNLIFADLLDIEFQCHSQHFSINNDLTYHTIDPDVVVVVPEHIPRIEHLHIPGLFVYSYHKCELCGDDVWA